MGRTPCRPTLRHDTQWQIAETLLRLTHDTWSAPDDRKLRAHIKQQSRERGQKSVTRRGIGRPITLTVGGSPDTPQPAAGVDGRCTPAVIDIAKT